MTLAGARKLGRCLGADEILGTFIAWSNADSWGFVAVLPKPWGFPWWGYPNSWLVLFLVYNGLNPIGTDSTDDDWGEH